MCVCMCVHACMYVCMYVYMYVCVCVCVCVRACMYVCMYVYIYVCELCASNLHPVTGLIVEPRTKVLTPLLGSWNEATNCSNTCAASFASTWGGRWVWYQCPLWQEGGCHCGIITTVPHPSAMHPYTHATCGMIFSSTKHTAIQLNICNTTKHLQYN